jgi:hypothetical protein
MSAILRERLCAEADDQIVVFAIGMRINRLWKVWRWLPVFWAMAPMLRELMSDSGHGLLSTRTSFGWRQVTLLQHWRSVEALQAYAHAATHLGAWQRFNAAIGTSGDVGIWHETYAVPQGHLESVYVNMPRYGLGIAGTLHPARGTRASAAKRLAGMAAAD